MPKDGEKASPNKELLEGMSNKPQTPAKTTTTMPNTASDTNKPK
jgi:hypothetical protein